MNKKNLSNVAGSLSASLFLLSLSILTGCQSGSSDSTSSPTASTTGTATTPPTTTSSSCSDLTGSHMFMRSNEPTLTSIESPKGSQGSLKSLRGHVLKQIALSQDHGKMDETQTFPITISLNLKDEPALLQELAQIYNPSSNKYHQFLTPEEFRNRFSPTQDQINQITQYLEQQGFHSTTIDKNGLLVHTIGTIKAINSTFNTEIHQYKAANSKSYYAPNQELQVPHELPIQGVHGIQNFTVAHNHARQKPASKAASDPVVTSLGGTGPGNGYSPADIRTAYNVPSNLDGTGETLALFELDGYNASDITTYAKKFNLPNANLQNILIDGYNGSAGSGAAEVTLDIELMMALAPKADKILVYEGPNSEQGVLDVYGKIANDNLAKSVSSSWGSSEDSASSSFIQAENTIFMQMAAQGQTIYSAAGDTGAKDNGSTLSIDDPSGQPYVVAVGGTTLSTSSTGHYLSETTWNNGSGAGGGGISTVWTIPSWQKGLATTSNKASSTMRNIPDVALHSDENSGYAIYTGGAWGVWGGTSCAAPLWAAFNALLNQRRTQNGLGPIGYITPILYAAAANSSLYSSDFFDINDGSTNGYYPAVKGYDAATGWGSFNATHLIEDLAQNPQTTPPNTPSDPTGTGGVTVPTNSCPST